MVDIVRRPAFEQSVRHIRDVALKQRLKKQILRIIENPMRAGGFLSHSPRFEKRVYLPPFRLIFSYDKEKDIIYLIDFDKRDRIYDKR